MKRRLILGSAVLAAALAIVQGGLAAQGRGGQGAVAPAQPQAAQQAALIYLTGYWVSVVDEDWRFRMMTPPNGGYAQVPMTPAARPIADQFNPELYGGADLQASGVVDFGTYRGAKVMRLATRAHS